MLSLSAAFAEKLKTNPLKCTRASFTSTAKLVFSPYNYLENTMSNSCLSKYFCFR